MNLNWIWLPAAALTLATGCLGSDQLPIDDDDFGTGGSLVSTGGSGPASGGFGATGGSGPASGGFGVTGGTLEATGGWDPGPTGGTGGDLPWSGGVATAGGTIPWPPPTGGIPPTGGVYSGGYAVGGSPASGGYIVETGGSWSCDCPLPPDDRCVNVYCAADGSCRYESYASMTDADGDGASDACDCDDNNPDIYPGQKNYFDVPHDVPPPPDLPVPPPGGTGGITGGPEYEPFDYSCDWQSEQRYTRGAQPCVALPGVEACEGGGWLDREDWDAPWCGETAPYQVCKYQDGDCVAVEIELTQACR